MSRYAKSLCHPAVVGIAKTMLDAHCRIANVGHRNIPSDDQVPIYIHVELTYYWT